MVTEVCKRPVKSKSDNAILLTMVHFLGAWMRSDNNKKKTSTHKEIGWESKFGTTKCRTADISEFRNFEY